MKAWYYIAKSQYDDILAKGELSPQEPDEFCREGEEWLKKFMAQKVGFAPDAWPINLQTRDYDLDQLIKDCYPGDYVLLELDIPEERGMKALSCAYSCGILNSGYVSYNEANWEEFNAVWSHVVNYAEFSKLPEEEQEFAKAEYKKANMASWPRIFDIDAFDKKWAGDTQYFVVGEVLESDIVKATPFVGTYLEQYYGPSPLGRDDMPPVSGYGDDIYIDDKFQRVDVKDGDRKVREDKTYTLRGYDPKGHGEGLICIYADDSEGNKSSFCIGRGDYVNCDLVKVA